MTKKEEMAVHIADQYIKDVSTIEKVKHLGTEYAELCMAIQENNYDHIEKEIGDMAFILLHLASRYEVGLEELIKRASHKMIERKGMKKR